MSELIKILKYIVPFAVFMGIVIFFWNGLQEDPSLLPSAFLNKPTPEFNLTTLEPSNVPLTNKIFQGHVSLLNVWASWCSSCSAEHPELMDIAKMHQVPLYGLDYKDNRNTALHILNRYGNPYQKVGFDQDGHVAIDWGVYGTPETFVIDSQGIIRYKYIGPITTDVWQQTLLPLILKLQKQITPM